MSYALAEAYSSSPVFVPQIDRGVSNEAAELREWLALSISSQSSAVTGRQAEIADRITNALVNAFDADVLPLPGAISRALGVMCSLPYDVELPSVVVEDDGEIGLDWDNGDRRVLSVIVSDTSMLRYAALIGPEPLHGRVPFAGILPATLSYVLQRIYSD